MAKYYAMVRCIRITKASTRIFRNFYVSANEPYCAVDETKRAKCDVCQLRGETILGEGANKLGDRRLLVATALGGGN